MGCDMGAGHGGLEGWRGPGVVVEMAAVGGRPRLMGDYLSTQSLGGGALGQSVSLGALPGIRGETSHSLLTSPLLVEHPGCAMWQP